MDAPDERLFPYMFWAHTESYSSPYCLSQSGMPLPPLEGIAPTDGELLAWAAAEAQPALEKRLAGLFALPPERVLATVGSAGAMLLAAQRWFTGGTQVLVERPRYQALAALPRAHGAEVVDLERTLENGWRVDTDEIAARVRRASGPVHVFLTNPHNPSGAVLGAEEMAAIAHAVEPSGGRLVSNEVYMEYAPSDARVHAAHVAPNAVSMGSLTKAYGLGPLRVGWVLFGEGLEHERELFLDRAYLAWVDPPTGSLVSGLRALDRLEEIAKILRRTEAETRPHLVRWLRESTAVEALIPPFGMMAFPRIRGVSDTRGLQRFLARDHGVDVVAGEDFDAPGFLRVGAAVPEATLVEGLVRLENGIRSWLERPPETA